MLDQIKTSEGKIRINLLKDRGFSGAKVHSEPLEDGVDDKTVVAEERHTTVAECVQTLIQLLVQLLHVIRLQWRTALKK